jgi:prepilin-type N-terminal cleavage/methylation domain-containing protein
MLAKLRARHNGFTIIELLIVIVVIGILASILFVSYSGAQAKSRDSRRITDAKAIEAALESYRSANSDYPSSSTATQVGGASTGSWETSGAAQPGTFISSLKNYGLPDGTPIDPTNSSLTITGYTYMYQLFPAGSNSCAASLGDYYVFIIEQFETSSGTQSQSPGFSCPGIGGHDWKNDGAYVVGHFVNE